MSYDPYAGVSQQKVNTQGYLEAMDQLDPDPPLVLDDLWNSNNILDSAAGILGNATTMMPGQVAESAWYRGQNAASVIEEYEGVDALFDLEDQKDRWLEFVASTKDWKIQKQAWDQLPGQLRASLQASGIQPPSEPPAGGFEIPFTSGLKRVLDIVPGDQFGPGNIELFGGSDNAFVSGLDQIGDAVAAPIEQAGKPLVSGVFQGLTWMERNLVSRPFEVAQLAAAEAGWDGAGGDAGMPNVLSQFGANLAFGVKSIFEGRVDELWQMTEDSRGTFKPQAMEDSLNLLDGSLEMQALAVEFVRTGYDKTETAAKISGAEPGDPQYEQTLMMLSRAMPTNGAENDFSRALQTLERNRIGIGHQMSETWLGTDQGTGLHSVSSALLELGILMVIDPTIVAGKANTVRKLAKFGVQSGKLMENVHRARILARGAEALDAGDDIVRAVPKIEDLVRATDGALDVKKATVMLANQGQISRIADNRFVRLIVSEDAQLRYGRQVDNVMKRISWAANGVDDAGNAYVWRDLYREVPATVRMSEQLTNAASLGELATKEKVWDFMESAAGYSTMMSGLGRSAKVVTLPMMNDAHRGWAATKNWWTKTIDLSQTLPDEIKQGIEELSQKWQTGQISVGEFNEQYRKFQEADPRRGFDLWKHEWGGGKQVLQRLSQHVTRDPLIVVSKGAGIGAQSRSSLKGIAEFGRYLEYGKTLLQMSDTTLDNYMQVFVNGNEAERMFAVRSFTAEMLMRSGALDGSKEANDLMKGFGLMLDQNFLAKRNFDDVLSSTSDAIARHSAIWGTQNAEFVTIPKFEELARAMRKKHAWDLFGQAVGQVDAGLSKWWKPAVLMRIGFIARAAGEETLSFALRVGFGSYAKAQFGRRWSQAEILNPVTNEWESIEDLSPMFRRIVSMGQGLRKWTKTRDEDIMQIIQLRMLDPKGNPTQELLEARALTKALYSGLGGVEREETIGRLAALFQSDIAKKGLQFRTGVGDALTGDERALIGQRLVDLFEPHRQEYLAQLPRTSRKIAQLGEWAVTTGLEMSPQFYDMMRALKMPSRKGVARAFGFDETRALGNPAFRHGARRFSIRPANLQMNDWTNLSVNDYQAAAFYASHNPTIARIRANSMSGVWADIGAGSEDDLLRHVSRSHLSDERKFVEKTKRSGRKYYVPLSSPDRTTRFVDIANQDAREAVGNMLAIRANDEVLRNSGAFGVMNSFIDEDMAVQLERKLGSDWEAVIVGIRQSIVDLDTDVATDRDKLAFLRRALTASDSLAVPKGLENDPFYQIVAKLDELPDRIRWLAHPDQKVAAEPLRFDFDEAWAEIDRRTWRYMQRPAYQPTLQSTMRVSVLNGKRIAAPLNKNHVRYVGVSMRADFADMLERLGTDPARVKLLYSDVTRALMRRGYSSGEAEAIVLSVDLVHRNKEWIPKVAGLFGHVEGPKYLPATEYLFTDPTLAQDVAMAMDEAVAPFLRELAEIDPRYVANDSGIFEVGMVDIPKKMAADHRNFLPLDGAGSIVQAKDEGLLVNFERLDPGNKVTFVEQADGTWIDELQWQALPAEERQTLTGKVQWANGMSDWAARFELNHKRTEDMRLTMTNSKGGFLNEVIGPMAANTFEPVFHTFRIHADDLPQGAYAPLEVPIETTMFSRLAQGFFQGVADPAMEAIIRSSHFMHNFASNLPFADEYYHLAIRSKLNDQVLAKFEDLGVPEEDLAELIDNIHLLYGTKPDDEDLSNMAMLISELSDPNTDPEDGLARLYAVLRTDEDKLSMAHDSMVEGLVENHRMEWGVDPDPEQLANYEELAGLGTDGKFDTETIADRLEYLQNKLAALGDELTPEHVDLDNKIKALVDTQYLGQAAPTEPYKPRKKPEGWFDDPAEQQFFWQQLQTWAGMRYHRFQEGMEMAAVRATNMTVEFIDDHRFRSQFQQTVRNLMPFWFAEEQFIKRQLRMLAETPEAIRKASLLMNAGRDMGIIDQDADGNEIFVYPGSIYINRELARFAGLLSGVDGLQVYAQPMSTQVEYMLPGYSGKLVDPSFGPMMGFSTALLSEFFPELEPLDREGFLAPQEVGQGRRPWEHFYPQSVANIIDAIGLPFFDRGRLQAAENQAVQLAVAAGLDPGDDATPLELEKFRHDIRKFARIQLAMNAGMYLGAPLPSGAKLRLGDLEIQNDMREILFNQGIPWQEAMAELLRLHPDATPFTVFGTESTSGAPMDLNHESYQWLNEHDNFLTEFPTAGAWLMPVRDGIQTEDEVSKRAQFEALEMNVRSRRTTEEFLNEIYISEAARQYYPRIDEFDRQIWLMEKQGQDTAMLEQQRAMFKEMFMRTHPVFADRETNQERRNDMKMERDRLLQMNPDELPSGPHVPVLMNLMSAHSQFNQVMDSIEGSSNEAREMREQVRTQFILWAADYVAQNPATEAYFRSHIRWDDQVTQAGPGLIFEIEAMLGREL